jgi:hypothetical protein
MTRPTMIKIFLILLSVTVCLTACLFDKPPETIDLKLSKLPEGTDSIVVRAVDKSDTNIVIVSTLHTQKYTPGMVLNFPVGAIQGRESTTLLKVEGYRGSLLVYLSLIPSASNSTDEVLFPDVTQNWPTISFTNVTQDSTGYFLTTAIRGAPANVRWLLSPNVPQANQLNFSLSADSTTFRLGLTGLVRGTWIKAVLRESNNKDLPNQVSDSMLTDEVIAPSGASVDILDARRVVDTVTQADSIEIKLDIKNFTPPSRDEPMPGKGWPIVLDARGLHPIKDFHVDENDFTHLIGPTWRLAGVSQIVVALYYADSSRVSPLISDTILSSAALIDRTTLPTVKIDSHQTIGTSIRCQMTWTNFKSGMHVHIYRDQVGNSEYQLCYKNICDVQASVSNGATRLIAIVTNANHSYFIPQSRDTLLAPF